MGSLHKTADIARLSFPRFDEDTGTLTVFEGAAVVPFELARVFVITAGDGAARGKHAHRECTQLIVALTGHCTIYADDGTNTAQFSLEAPESGLLVPPSIWLRLDFHEAPATLLALCDRHYEEADYIRDYDEFLEFRRAQKD